MISSRNTARWRYLHREHPRSHPRAHPQAEARMRRWDATVGADGRTCVATPIVRIALALDTPHEKSVEPLIPARWVVSSPSKTASGWVQREAWQFHLRWICVRASEGARGQGDEASVREDPRDCNGQGRTGVRADPQLARGPRAMGAYGEAGRSGARAGR